APASATSGQAPVLRVPYNLSAAAAAILLIVIVRTITRGPVGRVPAAAQQAPGPQDGPAGPGPAYPQVPVENGNGRLAAGAGYALSGLAVVVAAALTAAAIAGQSIGTTHEAARRPAPAATPTPTPALRQLTGDQLRAGDCIQRPRDVNTASAWPDLATAVPRPQAHTPH